MSALQHVVLSVLGIGLGIWQGSRGSGGWGDTTPGGATFYILGF